MRKLAVLGMAMALLAGGAGTARADWEVSDQNLLKLVRARYENLTPQQVAAAGYVADPNCVGTPFGFMGFHAQKRAFNNDNVVRALDPELLLLDEHGRVVGIEYETWDAKVPRPSLFGLQFSLSPGHPGREWAHYMLHIHFQPNGQYFVGDFNPARRCPAPAEAVAMPAMPQALGDPAKETVLIGEARLADMRIKLELEPAKAMSMPMDGLWTQMQPTGAEKYHVEVKPEDPQSNTRISYAVIRFSATNHDTGERIDLDLHPMWGSSGLHYAANSALPDGTYRATVVVGVPSFARAPADRERWMAPIQAEYEFRLEQGLLVSARVTGAGAAAAAPTPTMPDMGH